MLFVQVSQAIGHAVIVTPLFNGRYAEHRRRAVCTFPSCAERILVLHSDIVFLERVPHRPDNGCLPVGKREEIEFHLVTTLDAETDQQEQQHDRKDEDEMIDSHRVEYVLWRECVSNNKSQHDQDTGADQDQEKKQYQRQKPHD